MDSNATGVLDADEVSATSYICNCALGAWVGVNGTAVQAQSNTCYIARSDTAQLVVTLPANPAVGDLVRVRGAGLGGWKIAQNAGQAVNAKNLGAVAGVHWVARGTRRDWRSVASSADGSKLVAVVADGQIYTSTDSGLSWTARESGSRNWNVVASSADGSKLVGVVADPSLATIYTSTASTTPGVGGSISGTSSDTIELQYVGDGMFTVLGHVGSPTVQ